jgi:hypothetical protein
VNLGIGTKSGLSAAREWNDIQFMNFSYLNSHFTIPETENNLVIGTYYANNAYAGDGNSLGVMIGVQAEVIKDKLNIIGDYLSGINTLSIINLGLQMPLYQQWQLALAVQLPSPGSGNNHGGVIQFSKK